MFCVNIALGSTVWRLLYKEEGAALDTYMQLRNVPTSADLGTDLGITVSDDYGQQLSVVHTSMHGIMFEDLDKAKMANVELFLHQQRVQAMATKAAQSDPGLRASSMMNGPGVLTPLAGMPRQ